MSPVLMNSLRKFYFVRLSREKIEIQFVDKRDKICYADSSNERNEGARMTGTCEDCAYNVYDDEMDEYVCEAYLDEDEFYRVQTCGRACPLPLGRRL